ncbi:hypothetical protein [Streptacidiphilus rugosus]|uniref:hypothetical protein n=1 Tax=Streptacidiphilus rugosus TaxID=405783 RepID=UPI00056689BC|nr:hypothetical protein [Streptacidiphilus rugosus]
MKSVAVAAVALGIVAVGLALFAGVAAVLRARARRLGRRPESPVRPESGPVAEQDGWVYVPWRNVPRHHFGQGHHCPPGQGHPGGDGHHHGGHHGGDLGGHHGGGDAGGHHHG